MVFFKRLIDVFTLGSDRPVQRLVAYYAVLVLVFAALMYLFPSTTQVFLGAEAAQSLSTPRLLEDGLAGAITEAPTSGTVAGISVTVNALLSLLVALSLMLPVSWVYMSASKGRRHDQSVAQTLLVLPIVVAGVVAVVQNSLALAFSLAGVVAAVRFRTTLADARDVVFIFLAIAVGFAAGVQVLMVAAMVSVVFNIVLMMIWRYDFGRNVLEPTAAAEWSEPLKELAREDVNGNGKGVPDRDLVLALTPSKAQALAERFNRVKTALGPAEKKPRYNAIVSVTTSEIGEAQRKVEEVLDQVTKRWKLDEVVTHTGKPSELYYLVRSRKSIPRDAIVTAIRERANGNIGTVDVEVGDAVAEEKAEKRELRKQEERRS